MIIFFIFYDFFFRDYAIPLGIVISSKFTLDFSLILLEVLGHPVGNFSHPSHCRRSFIISACSHALRRAVILRLLRHPAVDFSQSSVEDATRYIIPTLKSSIMERRRC